MDYPIVFIPGLFGSLGDDVISGTGDFSFGFAENIYRPFIEILNSMGYIEGQNLFISYFDWKKPVLEAVNKYLLPDIEYAKKKTGSSKVILLGYSLGGLLARAYMTYFNPSSVEKIIMIGTPNLGAANAYCFWSGGIVPYFKIKDNILYRALRLGFIMYYRLFHNMNYIEALRDLFPVAKDLLPSYRYGNYLLFKENGVEKQIPIENMLISNLFLNELEKRPLNKSKLYIIAGSGSYTNEGFLVDIKNKGKIKWTDGKPIDIYKTFDGDGTVTTTSTLGYLDGNSIVLKENHTDILYKSKDYLSYILNRPLAKEVKEKKIEKVYVILAQNCTKINVKTLFDNEISSEKLSVMDNRIQAINLSPNNFWIMVAGDKNLEIELDVEPIRGIAPKIYMSVIQE